MDRETKIVFKVVLCILVFIVGLVLFLGSFSVVPAGHGGVYVVLGKVAPSPMAEGWNWKKPIISSIKKVSLQQVTMNGKTQCFSKDLQTLDVEYSVLYRLPGDKIAVLYQQYRGDPFESLIYPRLQQVLKETVSAYPAEEAVKKREEIRSKCLRLLVENMGNLLNVNDLTINNIDLSDQLEHSIEAKMVEEQKALSKKYEKQQAEIQAEIIVIQAKAEAEAVKIKGEALKASPEVIQLEVAKRWNGVSPQSVVVTNGGANVLLPLK